MKKKIVAAFETWHNGGLDCSSLYTVSRDGQERVDNFVSRHYESGTFAQLHTFTSEEEANKEYEKVIR